MDPSRRFFVASIAAALSPIGRGEDMASKNTTSPGGAAMVEQIPVIWELPGSPSRSTKLVIWLPSGLARMETARPVLLRLAAAGYIAVSFDSWERGSRASEPMETLLARAWANYPRVAWPLYGNGALEVLRVADWAAREFGVAPPFAVGGVSTGGDIAVAAAGLDRRIGCVAALIATPDWKRPGTHVDGKLVAAGEADAYAGYFYERMNPITNLPSYSHRPAMTFG